MYLLGTTLTKLLATLAAVMTVTAGMPLSVCQCPDGRVKLFCHGKTSTTPDSCCRTVTSHVPGAGSCCGAATKPDSFHPTAPAKKRPCCGRNLTEPSQELAAGSSRVAVKPGSCVKTIVPANPAAAVVAAVVTADHAIDTITFGDPAVVLPTGADAAATARPPPGSSTSRDLVVVLCHFTC